MSENHTPIRLPNDGEHSKIYTMLNTCYAKGKHATETNHYYASPEIMLFMYYLYLTAKYRKICYHKTAEMGITTDISNDLDFREEDHSLEEDIHNFAENIIQCIRQPRKLFVFPLSVQFEHMGRHANLLIYRRDHKDMNQATHHTIEHFEPNGAGALKHSNYRDLKNTLDIIMDVLRKQPDLEKLVYNDNPFVCPIGLQAEEANIPKELNRPYETGYCGAWSMFITELVLEHPSMSTKDIVEAIFDTKSEVERVMPFGVYLRYVIRGYTSTIQDKLNKYFKDKLKIGTITFEKLKDYDTSDKVYERLEQIMEHASQFGYSKTQLMAKSKFRKLFENITPINSKSKSPQHTTRRRRHSSKSNSDKKITDISPPLSKTVSVSTTTTQLKTRRRHS
jgi:hypothetical protein